ncbi:hypothetical protein ACQPZP_05830 [Spirillospora sp. CA-142024]|uniref:hypothetical protein n=1 Tax=Spirillospora sp. CA-142024 TaxID=3240036 RepID=UPI003D912887
MQPRPAKAYFMFRSTPLDHDHRDIAEHRRLVSAAFAADTSWRTREPLDSALADPDFYFDALGQVRMNSWSTGRIALVGDAAWCASRARAPSWHWSAPTGWRGELAAAGGDHRVAFARYDTVHRPLVERKQQIGPNVSLMVPKTEGGRCVRAA